MPTRELISIQGTRVEIPDQTFWQLEVCNACRYCEGYCAVFPALERKRRFTPDDVVYLANLCHDCRACFYACMYAPPHEFGVNIPKALAEVREQTYAQYALPTVVSNLAQRNAWLLVDRRHSSVWSFFGSSRRCHAAGLFAARQGPGAFYSVIPYLVMMLPALLLSLYAIGVMLAGAFAFAQGYWRAQQRHLESRRCGAAGEAFSLRYLARRHGRRLLLPDRADLQLAPTVSHAGVLRLHLGVRRHGDRGASCRTSSASSRRIQS